MKRKAKYNIKKLINDLEHILMKIYKILPLAILVCFLIVGLVFQYKNFVPNVDFFAYVSDGNNYLHGRMPYSLKHPPIYSILITLPSLFIHYRLFELQTAVFLNIFLMFFSLIFISQWIKKIDTDFVLPITILLTTNFLTFLYIFQPMNNTLFFLLLSSALLLDIKGKNLANIVLTGFGCLIRPEAIAILLPLLIKYIYINKQKILQLKNILLPFSLLFTLSWELLTFFYGFSYVDEVKYKLKNIPNWSFLYNSFHHYLFIPQSISIQVSLWVMLILISSGFFLFLKDKKVELFLLFLFSIFYTGIHVIFPEAPDRYSQPLLLLSYLSILAPIAYLHKQRLISIEIKRILLLFIVLFFAYHNILPLSSMLENDKFWRFENILIANYLNSTVLPKNTAVVTLEPWVVQHYLTNSNVNLVPVPKGCVSVECIANTTFISQQSRTLVILDNYNTLPDSETDFFKIGFGGKFFLNLYKQQGMNPIYGISFRDKWIKVYEIH